MTKLVAFVAWFSLCSAACFDPEPARCLPCKESCPAGEMCIDGLCQTQVGECSLGANTSLCGEACCIDGACFDLKRHMPPDSLALWLDWTSLYESQSLPVWRDRSPNTYSFINGGRRPMVASSATSDAKLLHFSAPGQFVTLNEPEAAALDNRDFLWLAAGALSCDTTRPVQKQCLVSRIHARGGVRVCASLDPEQVSLISPKCDVDEPTDAGQEGCLSAVIGVTCGQMQLLSLHRSTPDAADGGESLSAIELRHNGVVVEQITRPREFDVEAANALRIGGHMKFGFLGDLALVALFVGHVGAREACELERFVLERMAAAKMSTAEGLPDCSAL